jgi:hypothetical protein
MVKRLKRSRIRMPLRHDALNFQPSALRPYLDQLGSVTLPRPLTTGVDFPVGTSNREMVLPVL